MNVSENIEVNERYCRFRPADTVSTVEAVEQVAQAIAFCRERKIPKLLVDWSRLTQVTLPTLVDRFLMVEDWAEAGNGSVIVAMVVPPGLIHPQKFGAKVAENLGLIIDGFPSEREAMEWLLAESETSASPPLA
jgi:hypothetical protein